MEAFETLLWQEADLEDLNASISAWESFGDGQENQTTAAQIAQWKGAWRTWKNHRWMLLNTIEAYVPCMDFTDRLNLWEVLVRMPQQDQDRSELRLRFLEITQDSNVEVDGVSVFSHAKKMMNGYYGGIEQLDVVDDCYAFVEKYEGKKGVGRLFFGTSDWLFKRLTNYTQQGVPENRQALFKQVLMRLEPDFIARADHQISLQTSLIEVLLREQNAGYYADDDACAMLLSELASNGMDMDAMVRRVLNMEGLAKDARIAFCIIGLINAGADWKKIPTEQQNEMIQNAVLNHPQVKRARLKDYISPSLSVEPLKTPRKI